MQSRRPKSRQPRKRSKSDIRIEPGFYIYANPEQLDQVLLNLVENAVKFTPDGGKVTIKSGDPGKFSVEDTGIGMPAHEIPENFCQILSRR